MLFFKPKPKIDEILPPPPPFPSLDFDEELRGKPKFFDEVVKPGKAENIPEIKEFDDMVEEMEQSKPEKNKRQKIQPKMPQKKSVKLKKEKKSPASKKTSRGKISRAKVDELPQPEDDFSIPKEIELPETLDEPDIEDFRRKFDFGKDFGSVPELETKTKPKEILEAEEEIKSAIDKIKKQEKPSFFKKLFEKKERFEEKPKHALPFSIPESDGVSKIKNSAKKAREALMRFDLEAAKREYIEIMRIYNNIMPEEQAKVYQDIRDLYFERKSAEELKI